MPQSDPSRRIPGEPGLWALILGDLAIFSVFFVTIVYYRHLDPQMFAASQQRLDMASGLINTVLLLTASLFVMLSARRVRNGEAGGGRLVACAITCAITFVVVKLAEYRAEIMSGIRIGSDDFFTLYFAFTGIHLMHVVIGIGVLLFLHAIARRTGPALTAGAAAFESGAIFWHLVDLLWLVLFALFYVAR